MGTLCLAKETLVGTFSSKLEVRGEGCVERTECPGISCGLDAQRKELTMLNGQPPSPQAALPSLSRKVRLSISHAADLISTMLTLTTILSMLCVR